MSRLREAIVAKYRPKELTMAEKKKVLFGNLNALKEQFNEILIETTFQSRFGPQEWLTPYTDKTIESLPGKGKKNILVICPNISLLT